MQHDDVHSVSHSSPYDRYDRAIHPPGATIPSQGPPPELSNEPITETTSGSQPGAGGDSGQEMGSGAAETLKEASQAGSQKQPSSQA